MVFISHFLLLKEYANASFTKKLASAVMLTEQVINTTNNNHIKQYYEEQLYLIVPHKKAEKSKASENFFKSSRKIGSSDIIAFPHPFSSS